MIDRDDFHNELNRYLSVSNFTDYCPNGLQVEGKIELKKIAFSVSVSMRSIKEAIKAKADALVVHHGLFWNKDPMPIIGSKKERLSLLLEHQISLFAYHLPLDAHQVVGNNWTAAKDMGWSNIDSFEEIGVKGTFDTVDVDVFVKDLEKFYSHPAQKALGGPSKIKSAALISGGAYRQMQAAIDEGVDCFITGNFDEPAWHLAHEEGIHFVAMGHAATERIGVAKLSKLIESKFNVDVVHIEDDNPF